jgi:hypothetical protein
MIARWLTIFVSIAAFGGPVLAQPATPTALELYDRAYAAAQAERVPPYVDYVMHIAYTHRGTTEREDDHIILRTSDGAAFIESLNASKQRTPPHVANRPPYGVAPIALVGLYHYKAGGASSIFEAPETPAPSTSPPAEIGRVTATAHPYDVTFATVTANGSGDVEHLLLMPLFDSDHHTLRELYLDSHTFLPVRSVVQAHLKVAGLTTRPLFTIEYSVVDGFDVISHAWTSFTFRVAFVTYSGAFDYTTSHISFPATEPDSLFR